jgi:hypothetical protein
MTEAAVKEKPAQAVAVQQSAPPAVMSESVALLEMIERAARDPQVDIAKMRELMAMRKEVLSDRARVAYSAALSAMQLELPVIGRRGTIELSTSKPNPKYALWEDINEAIKPVLAKHGFALSFRIGKEADRVVVTGILSHAEGHAEETTMSLPVDNGPGRNAVQSVGSSTSYGKRYTASALLNLTSRGEDDDGKAADNTPITEAQLQELIALADDVGADKIKFCKYLKVAALAEVPARRFQEAMDALEAKRAK